MAYTQSDIEKLEGFAARGVLRGKMPNGEEVQFDTLDALRRQIRVMKDEVSGGAVGQMSVTYPKTTRGL